jgi:DDE superfamily endonuclease
VEKGGLREALGAVGVPAPSPLGFADEMRVGLHGTVRRVWGRRGVKVRQAVQFDYEWRYLFIAVDPHQGCVHWCWLEAMASLDIEGALRGLRQSDLTALVWDRAASHRTARVRAVGWPLISLPPYSPELNPAERIFEELRREVDGKVYPTLDAKVAAVHAALQKLDAAPDRVRSLTNWSWIAAAAQDLPTDIAA